MRGCPSFSSATQALQTAPAHQPPVTTPGRAALGHAEERGHVSSGAHSASLLSSGQTEEQLLAALQAHVQSKGEHLELSRTGFCGPCFLADSLRAGQAQGGLHQLISFLVLFKFSHHSQGLTPLQSPTDLSLMLNESSAGKAITSVTGPIWQEFPAC